jgi:hypothetical protein
MVHIEDIPIRESSKAGPGTATHPGYLNEEWLSCGIKHDDAPGVYLHRGKQWLSCGSRYKNTYTQDI